MHNKYRLFAIISLFVIGGAAILFLLIRSGFSVLRLHKAENDSVRVKVYLDSGAIFLKKNKPGATGFRQAKILTKKAINLADSIQDFPGLGDAYHQLSEICKNEGNISDARKYASLSKDVLLTHHIVE